MKHYEVKPEMVNRVKELILHAREMGVIFDYEWDQNKLSLGEKEESHKEGYDSYLKMIHDFSYENRIQRESIQDKRLALNQRVELEISSIEILSYYRKTDLGTVRLYKFVDTEGNVYHWRQWNSNPIPENTKKIRGTVVDHHYYNGENYTSLKRCKAVA